MKSPEHVELLPLFLFGFLLGGQLSRYELRCDCGVFRLVLNYSADACVYYRHNLVGVLAFLSQYNYIADLHEDYYIISCRYPAFRECWHSLGQSPVSPSLGGILKIWGTPPGGILHLFFSSPIWPSSINISGFFTSLGSPIRSASILSLPVL